MPTDKRPLYLLPLVLVFSGAWFLLASQLTTWSDEISHLALAKQLLGICSPWKLDFAQCASNTPNLVYSLRAIEFTQMVSLAFQFFGVTALAGRSVPFVFTLAAWLFFVVYLRLRQKADGGILVVTSLLYFGQSMVLEQALNVRFYAPLMFCLLVSLVALWETRQCWREDHRWRAGLWLAIGITALGVSMLWSLLQYAILALAIILMGLRENGIVQVFCKKIETRFETLPRNWQYTLGVFGILLIVLVGMFGPFAVDLVGALVLRAQRVHVTFLDNVFGLLRLAFALNVILYLWKTIWKNFIQWGNDFYQWLLTTGVVSALVLGYLMNHNFVYYGRYFYLSVVVAALAAAPTLLRLSSRSKLWGALAIYLTANFLLSTFVFGLERSNIRQAFEWIRENTTRTDLIFLGDVNLYFDGGGDLQDRVILVRVPVHDPAANQGTGLDYLRRSNVNPFLTAEEVTTILKNYPQGRIYYLTVISHDYRERIYRTLTGREWSELSITALIKRVLGWADETNDLSKMPMYWLLTRPEVSYSVLPDLVIARIFELDRQKLIESLKTHTGP